MAIHWQDHFHVGEHSSSTARIGRFEIAIRRFSPSSAWYMTGIFTDSAPLASRDASEAKCQAVAIVQSALEDAIKDILN